MMMSWQEMMRDVVVNEWSLQVPLRDFDCWEYDVGRSYQWMLLQRIELPVRVGDLCGGTSSSWSLLRWGVSVRCSLFWQTGIFLSSADLFLLSKILSFSFRSLQIDWCWKHCCIETWLEYRDKDLTHSFAAFFFLVAAWLGCFGSAVPLDNDDHKATPTRWCIITSSIGKHATRVCKAIHHHHHIYQR